MQTTALHIASEHACYEIVQPLLERGDCMMKRNRHSLTPFNQSKDERIRRIFAQFQRPAPRFASDVLEWTVPLQKSTNSRLSAIFQCIV